MTDGDVAAEGFSQLERLFAVDFEWSSWMLVSDETMGQVMGVSTTMSLVRQGKEAPLIISSLARAVADWLVCCMSISDPTAPPGLVGVSKWPDHGGQRGHKQAGSRGLG